MVYSKLPDELKMAITSRDWELGECLRMVHMECSEGKDACLSVIRKSDGWWFYCFRCQLKGFIGDGKKTPDEVALMMENMRKQKSYETMDVVSLPKDLILMNNERFEDVPWAAYRWLWDAMVPPDEYMRYGVGWSPGMNRVIVPIKEYASDERGNLYEKLIGWIGREVECKTKAERKEKGLAKYITKKSSEYEHIFFHAPAPDDHYVIVEDVLSAMRIRHAMNWNAIALLTTYMPLRLMMKLRKKKIVLWLDGDMTAQTMRYLTKMQQYGIDCKYVLTPKDPKMYNDVAIMKFIRRPNDTL